MASMTRPDVVTYSRERPGMSAFVLEDVSRLSWKWRRAFFR